MSDSLSLNDIAKLLVDAIREETTKCIYNFGEDSLDKEESTNGSTVEQRTN